LHLHAVAAKQEAMRIVVTLLAACAVLILGAGAALWWADRELTREGPPLLGGAIVSIAPGQSFATTARQLEQSGLVRHGWLLRMYARFAGLDRSVRSGDFHFEKPLAPITLLETLRSTQLLLERVTIREGLNLRQVAELLAEKGYGGADEYECLASDAGFLAELGVPATGLEGYLFPDTYALSLTTAPEEILRTMVERFREQVAPLDGARRARGMSEADMVTLAAIIEKETGIAAERATISAVFHNRLRLGMRLQSDPTSIYPWKEGVPTATDVRTHTPYNTYTNDGLPPGPICNPGRDALHAAVAPAGVDYLYFVSRGDGSHAFAHTLEEHNRNVTVLRNRMREAKRHE